ncbi:MAG: SDR family NAD(P)-dependent oxidoreductase [Deltaproteobacteria bacterium]|nr:SDR family NAD(P)-dependent oxidoreductase [Deltaproteobacteria bacterium]
MMKLDGKIALITGGSKGIGKGIAEAYLKQGAEVIICGRNEANLQATGDELKEFGQINYVVCDITKLDDVKRLASQIDAIKQKLDILVNNASILGARSSIMEYPEDVWEEVIHINLNAQFFVTKALLPLLNKSENSSIINVSSSVGRKGKKEWGAYAASKFGVEALTQVLAHEMEDTNVRVNSVNPGGTRTDMRAGAYPDEDPNTLPTPLDISPVFVYLASDESIDINGQEFAARDWIGK